MLRIAPDPGLRVREELQRHDRLTVDEDAQIVALRSTGTSAAPRETLTRRSEVDHIAASSLPDARKRQTRREAGAQSKGSLETVRGEEGLMSFRTYIDLHIIVVVACFSILQGCSTSTEPGNAPPQVQQIIASQTDVVATSGTYYEQFYSQEISLQAIASDPDGDALTYNWTTTGGQFYLPSGNALTSNPTTIRFVPVGENQVICIVSDGRATASAQTTITVRCPYSPPSSVPGLISPANGATIETDGSGTAMSYEYQHYGYRTSLELSTSDAVDANGRFTSIESAHRNIRLGSDTSGVFLDYEVLPPGTYYWHVAIVEPCAGSFDNPQEILWSEIRSFTIE
jgi:hypothetical protein